MKIRLLKTLPLEEKHGMVKGREFTVLLDDRNVYERGRRGVLVLSDAGEEVRVFINPIVGEAEVIEE